MASLGLLILAVVSGMIVGADRGTPVSVGSISYLIGTAIVFLAGFLVCRYPACAAYFSPLQSRENGFSMTRPFPPFSSCDGHNDRNAAALAVEF